MTPNEANSVLLKKGFLNLNSKRDGVHVYRKSSSDGGGKSITLRGVHYIHYISYIQEFSKKVRLDHDLLKEKLIKKYGNPNSIKKKHGNTFYIYAFDGKRIRLTSVRNGMRILTGQGSRVSIDLQSEIVKKKDRKQMHKIAKLKRLEKQKKAARDMDNKPKANIEF